MSPEILFIRRIGKLLLMLFTVEVYSYTAYGDWRCRIVSYSGYESKDCVVDAILQYPRGVEMFITKENPSEGGFSDYNNLFPGFWRYGLLAIKPQVSSEDISQSSIGNYPVMFAYHSDRYENGRRGVQYDSQHYVKRHRYYLGNEWFGDGRLRIAFMTRQSAILTNRISKIKGFHKSSNGQIVTIKPKINLKSASTYALSNSVYKICDGGVFTADEKMKKRMSFGSETTYFSSTNQTNMIDGFYASELISLSVCELSEIVYWLWHRDGKVSKYPELCKRHPELFEPISGLADFKTEIGRMLVERSKQ